MSCTRPGSQRAWPMKHRPQVRHEPHHCQVAARSASVYSKIGGWLPTGGLFRTASPGSGTIQAALKQQQQQQPQQQLRAGPASIFSKSTRQRPLKGCNWQRAQQHWWQLTRQGGAVTLLYRKLHTQLNTATSRGSSSGSGPGQDEAWVCGTVTEGAEGTEDSATDTTVQVEGPAKTDSVSSSRSASAAVSSAMGTSTETCTDNTGDGAAAGSPACNQAGVAGPPTSYGRSSSSSSDRAATAALSDSRICINLCSEQGGQPGAARHHSSSKH